MGTLDLCRTGIRQIAGDTPGTRRIYAADGRIFQQQNAEKLAAELRAGRCGYVYFDTAVGVIAAAYESQEDALVVKEQLMSRTNWTKGQRAGTPDSRVAGHRGRGAVQRRSGCV